LGALAGHDGGVIVSVIVRRLRQGSTIEDFRQAWYPERGFGVPSRIVNAIRLDDPREIVSIGFLDVTPDDLEDLAADIAAAEAKRHYRIEGVIESTELRAIYEIVDDEDFTDIPHPFSSGEPGAGLTAPRD
jgi:hypothetical protein